jgi:hypothetical protein
MNIFYLHHDPRTCAQMHVDRHVTKMIVEYSQLLSTAHRVLDGVATEERNKAGHRMTRYYFYDSRDDLFYKAAMVNHPSTKWTRANRSNYLWLHSLLVELLAEYKYRYNGKSHASEPVIAALATPPTNIPEGEFFQPYLAMDDEFRISSDAIINYRNYYINGKSHLFQYTKREMPDWLREVIAANEQSKTNL